MLTALIAIGLIVANFDRLRLCRKSGQVIALQILSLIYFIFSLMAEEKTGMTGPSWAFGVYGRR